MSAERAGRVLVTGGSGFLGRHLVDRYAAAGASVRVLGRRHPPVSPAPDGTDVPTERIELDLLDLTPATSAPFDGVDLVIHAAAVIRVSTLDERVQQRRVNVEGTRNVIDACRRHGVTRLLYVSTTAAIGIPGADDGPADERFEFNLEHLDLGYNLTKRVAQQLVLDANDGTLQSVVVNPGFIFGADGPRYRGREVIDRVLGHRIVLCTAGGLSVVHVDDVVDGLSSAAERGHPGQQYILSGENLSHLQIARTICLAVGESPRLVPVPATVTDAALRLTRSRLGRAARLSPPAHLDRRYSHPYYSSEKARRDLGYTPMPFADIVRDALRWGVSAPGGASLPS